MPRLSPSGLWTLYPIIDLYCFLSLCRAWVFQFMDGFVWPLRRHCLPCQRRALVRGSLCSSLSLRAVTGLSSQIALIMQDGFGFTEIDITLSKNIDVKSKCKTYHLPKNLLSFWDINLKGIFCSQFSKNVQTIQDLDKFVSSSKEIWRNLALHH